jgi:hypothetical protein
MIRFLFIYAVGSALIAFGFIYVGETGHCDCSYATKVPGGIEIVP